MASLNGFNAEEVEPLGQYEPLPAGDYTAHATASEWRETKAGTGRYLQITWEILDDQGKGRRLWSRLNLENENEKAVEIAQRELSSICRAVGVLTPKDTSELLNRPLRCKIKVRRTEQYGDQNEVVKYSPDKAGPTQPVVAGGDGSASAWAQTMGG